MNDFQFVYADNYSLAGVHIWGCMPLGRAHENIRQWRTTKFFSGEAMVKANIIVFV